MEYACCHCSEIVLPELSWAQGCSDSQPERAQAGDEFGEK
jgi:hypothetical protein